MKRRDFLKTAAAVSAMIACGGWIGSSRAHARENQPLVMGKRTPVSLAGVGWDAPEAAVRSDVREAALAATDFSWISRGDAVFIKPALNSGSPYPATTSPAAVAAMTILLKEKGAGRVIVGDMCGIEHVKLSPDGLSGSSRRLMASSGMAKAAQEAGAELHFFEEAGWKAFYEDRPLAGSHWIRGLMMPNILKSVDHIVLMPRCGRHVLAGSTLGLKAAVGYWRTDTRLEYHRDASTFQEKTAEGNTVETLLRKQRLVLSTADKLLISFGPDQGRVLAPENGLVIASAAVTAHDLVSLAWLIENRRHVTLTGKDEFVDSSRLVARAANHWVVNRLGGLGPAIASERLVKDGLQTVWDDRALGRAFQIFGGVPVIELDEANNNISADVKRKLKEAVAFPK
jgi:uncharacterized protein (DUF362 family)